MMSALLLSIELFAVCNALVAHVTSGLIKAGTLLRLDAWITFIVISNKLTNCVASVAVAVRPAVTCVSVLPVDFVIALP